MAGSVNPVSTATSLVAVEVKRRATIDAVDQLLRYLEAMARAGQPARGILVAQVVVPQAKVYAESKGIKTVEVDYDELRALVSPIPTLF